MQRVLTITGQSGRPLSALAAAMCLALATGCSGKTLDVGGGGAGGAGGGGPDDAAGATSGSGDGASCRIDSSAPWPLASGCRSAPGSPLVGRWSGHWPLISKTDGSAGGNEEVVLTISGVDASGLPCGNIRIGDGPPLPAAEDPEEAYPPVATSGAPLGMRIGPQFGNASPDTYSGYQYSLTHVISEGARLAFQIPLSEPWRGWCGLQTPPADATSCITDSAWGCEPAPGGDEVICTNDQGERIPTAQANLCGQFTVCECQGGCCDASSSRWAHLVELHRRSDGTLEGAVNTSTPLYLDPVGEVSP